MAFALLPLAGCHHSHHSPASVAHEADRLGGSWLPEHAELIRPSTAVWPEKVRVQGTLHADEQAVIGAKIAGRVAETFVELGDTVRRGDSLATLELEDFELQLKQAEAQLMEACAAVGLGPDDPLELLDPQQVPSVLLEKAVMDEARQNLQRMVAMRERNAISVSELDRQISLERVATARYQAAVNGVQESLALVEVRRTQLALARQNREDALIRAPFDGVVQLRHVATGVYVQPGAAIVTLVRNDPLRFRAGVPERKAGSIQMNQQVWIEVEGVARPIEARVVRISPALDLSSRALMVEAEVPNADGRLRSGLFAQADIIVDSEAKALALPASAVGEFAGVHKVWLLEGGRVTQRAIRAGRQDLQRIEVLSGLTEDDNVLLDFEGGISGARLSSHGGGSEEPVAQAG